MSVAITEAITTLAEAEQRFQLSRTEAEDFFLEWCNDLPELTNVEKTALTELRGRYMGVANLWVSVRNLRQTNLFAH